MARHVITLLGLIALAVASLHTVAAHSQSDTLPAPRIVASSPAPHEEITPEQTIQLSFDQPMDKASVQNALSITPKLVGRIEWRDDQTLTVSFATPPGRGEQYKLEIGAGAKSAKGVALAEPFRLPFDVAGNLKVSQVIPAPDTQQVQAASTITVIFNRPVVPLVNTADQGGLPQPLTLSPAVKGHGEWVNTSIFVFHPDQPLPGGTAFSATVSADLKDVTGSPLSAPYNWKFSTVAPQVLSISPVANQTLVPLDMPIQIVFNQPMDTASTEKALSVIGLTSGAAIEGKITWSNNNQQLTFTPAQRFSLSTLYRVTLNGTARSASGSANLSTPVGAIFTTVPYPAFVMSQPKNGDQNVYPGQGVGIQYNTPMDQQSFIGKVHVSPEAENFSISVGGQSLYVSFSSLPQTTYTVTVDAGVADVYGNMIKTPTVITFTTGSLQPSLNIATRDQVNLTNAYRPDTVILAASVNVSQIDVSVSAISPLNALQLLTTGGPSVAAPGSARSFTQKVENTPNKTAITKLFLGENGGGALKPGLYYLEVSSPETRKVIANDYRIRQFLVVGTANLTLKTTPHGALVWATDLKSGQPIAGAPITLYGEKGDVLFTGKTDPDGLYQTEFPASLNREQMLWAVAQGDGLYGLASNRSLGFNPYELGIPVNPAPETINAYLYTDQPLYRPGHPVYFRGIVRNQDDVHYSVPIGATAHVKLLDAEGKPVYEKDLPLNEFGVFSGQYDLPGDAKLGYYAIQTGFSFTDRTFAHQFQVAEYRPPEFQVAAAARADQVVAGDTIHVDVDSKFFFGGPVSGAKVTWNALANQGYFNYTGEGEWDFSPQNEQYVYGRSVGSGAGMTDGQGHFVIELPANLGGVNVTQSFSVEATITDVNNQAVSGRTTITVHPAKLYVGLRPETIVSEAGKPVTVSLIAVDWDSKPIAGQKVRVDVSTLSWEQDPKTLEWKQTTTPVIGDSVVTDAKGLASYTFTPAKAGLYRIDAIARDSAERLAASSTYIWVSGPQPFNFGRGDDKTLKLVSDKKQYLPGDTAGILIPSPFAGPVKALVTVERAGIIKTEVITVTSSLTYKLPISEDYAPDVYVAVTLVKGTDDQTANPDYRSGVVLLHTRVKQKLIVKLTPSTDKAKPGDTVRFDIFTTDLDGKPIAASVGLSLTDLANLSVANDYSGSIFDAFWRDRGLSVFTSISLSSLIDTIVPQPADNRVQKAGVAFEGGASTAVAPSNAAPPPAPVERAADGNFAAGQQKAQTVAVRINFVDTPLWAPDVRTGPDGRGSIDVKLPDNLTTWRLDGRGISKDTYAGQSTTDLLSTKPLLIRPSTPRFFVVGDEAELAAVVNNNTDSDLSVQVELDVKGATLKGDAAQTVTIPKAGRVRVAWQAAVQDVEAVDLTFTAISGSYNDASKPAVGLGDARLLPVYKYVAPDTVATAGTLTAAGTRTEGIILPTATAAPTGGSLTINLNPSLAAVTLDGLTYLKNYPYQCTEQTISKFLPNVITFRALQKLGQDTPKLKANLQTAISEALARLKSGQHPDGGWGWYPQEQSNPLVTAYAVLGLLEAKQSDLGVDPEMYNRAIAFLISAPKQVGRDTPVYELNTQAFLDFVLARTGNGNVGLLDNLFVQREKMNYFARAFMAQGYAAAKGDQDKINALLSDLSNAAILSATGAHWEEPQRDWWNWDSDTRTTAIVLKTLVDLTPTSELIPNVVRWLMVARRGDAWETTQETAWAVMALTDWMAASGELKADYSYNVLLNGAGIGDGKAGPETLRDTKTLSISIAQMLKDRINLLAVQRSEGNGALYYTATLTVDQPVEAIVPTSRGMSFTRRYLLNGKPVTSANVGDVLTVALDITVPHDLYYVVINDPIPAGVEAVDTSLKTTSQIGQPPDLNKIDPVQGWGWWWFSETQLRTEKAVLSARFLPSGTYRYVYQVRASQPGTYRVIPPNGQEFYFPEVFGRGAGSLFTVK